MMASKKVPPYLYESEGEKCLGLSSFVDSQLAAIVSAVRAYLVVFVERTAVGAYCQCRRNCLIVSSTFTCACFGLPSFRMCHCIKMFVVYFILGQPNGLQATQL